MSLRVYNTLTRRKEDFKTLKPGVVSMYVCGPTVYDKAHIGHAMSSLVFDIIRRYLEYKGYRVIHIMNYTDVDDKIIQRSTQLGMDPIALAEQYASEYDQHLKELNILPATVNPRATQEMDQIIRMVQALKEKNYAYEVEGDVYFRVEKFDQYGKLSGRRLDDLQAGARVDVDERKENPLDFALWKAAKPGEPAWKSPWSMGRPGWHIECSAMNLTHLGEQIDIHGGGNDLIFPHHENEIAQTESVTGMRFANYWIHNGMLQLLGEKMSKSLGNLVTIEEFLLSYDADALRMMVLNSSYRGPLSYNEEIVLQAERALDRLRSALRPAQPSGAVVDEQTAQGLGEQVEAAQSGFLASMDDDFNTAGALGHLFDLVRAINQAKDAGVDEQSLSSAQGKLTELAGVLGLRLESSETRESQADPYIDLLVEVRQELRKQKLWALSDMVRDRLSALNVQVEDGKDGSTWRWS